MAYRLNRGLGATVTPQVQSIAQAIATAEGGLTPGTFPYRTNNPCDVFVGGSTAGYSTMDAGWQACYNQIGLMLSGQSSVYTPNESISDIAASWTPASAGNVPANWANTVSSQLGLSPSDSLTSAGSSSAQIPDDSSTGLPASNTDGFDITALLSPTGDSASSGITLLDSSGGLTGWAWAGIAAGVGLVVWAVAR